METLEVGIKLDESVPVPPAEVLTLDGAIGGGDARDLPGIDPVMAVAVPLKLGREGPSLHTPAGTRMVTVTIEWTNGGSQHKPATSPPRHDFLILA